MRIGNDPSSSVKDEIALTPAASNVDPKTRQNPCLDEDSNEYGLATGPRHRSERSVVDVKNTGMTKLVVIHAFMDYKPGMPYIKSLYEKFGGRLTHCREIHSMQRESSDHISMNTTNSPTIKGKHNMEHCTPYRLLDESLPASTVSFEGRVGRRSIT